MNGQAVLYKYKNKYEFSWKMNILNPTQQVGSYFGSSVCVVDVNGDGKDDVLVGAPYHTHTQYDEGRVSEMTYTIFRKQNYCKQKITLREIIRNIKSCYTDTIDVT